MTPYAQLLMVLDGDEETVHFNTQADYQEWLAKRNKP